MTDRLFLNDSHFVFDGIMPKNRFIFLKGYICFDFPTRKNIVLGNRKIRSC